MFANDYNRPPSQPDPEGDALLNQAFDPATPEDVAERLFDAWVDVAGEERFDTWRVYDATRCTWRDMNALASSPPAGTTVFRLFWSSKANGYVTIPGASLYLVQADGTVALIDDPS